MILAGVHADEAAEHGELVKPVRPPGACLRSRETPTCRKSFRFPPVFAAASLYQEYALDHELQLDLIGCVLPAVSAPSCT